MADKVDKVRIRCLSVAEGVESEGSYGNESFTIDANGIAEVTPDTARRMLSEQGQMWVAEDLDTKLATGQSIPFQPLSRREARELKAAGEIPVVEGTDKNPREGNS